MWVWNHDITGIANTDTLACVELFEPDEDETIPQWSVVLGQAEGGFTITLCRGTEDAARGYLFHLATRLGAADLSDTPAVSVGGVAAHDTEAWHEDDRLTLT